MSEEDETVRGWKDLIPFAKFSSLGDNFCYVREMLGVLANLDLLAILIEPA